MLIIEYDPINGKVVPDGKVRGWADKLIEMYEKQKLGNLVTTVGSVLMVDATRLLVMKEKLNHGEVIYRFSNFADQSPDKSGMLRTWPKGFCDFYDDILEELLDYSMEDKE